MIGGLISTNADWYLMRSTGFVALALFTLSVALGVANLGRLAAGAWTRTVAALVHRNTSLLGVVFLAVHILTAISDRYVKIPALAIVVPGLSGYDPFWVGLGALAFDLLIAVIVTSLLRSRMGRQSWKMVHWLSYAMWPMALIHSVGSGTGSGRDTGAGWSTAIYLVCGLCFAVAVAIRIRLSRRPVVNQPEMRFPPRSGHGRKPDLVAAYVRRTP